MVVLLNVYLVSNIDIIIARMTHPRKKKKILRIIHTRAYQLLQDLVVREKNGACSDWKVCVFIEQRNDLV